MTIPLTCPPSSTTFASPRPSADLQASHTLLGTLAREVAGPLRQTAVAGEHFVIRLPSTRRTLRTRLRRLSPVGAHRFTGAVQLRDDPADEWADLGLDELAAVIDAELTARSGSRNAEFVGQVTASRDTLAELLRTRPDRPATPVDGAAGEYLDSEQALLAGHPRHPAPKWRSGDRTSWQRYAPEARTAFPLRWLSGGAEYIADNAVDRTFDHHADVAALLGADLARVPPGHRAIPVHPWQYQLVQRDAGLGPVLRSALASGILHDLGEIGARVHPTASVRTLYQPDTDVFLKTSLNIRITNCLRKNAAYELAGAVQLTRLLAGTFREVAAEHPGFDFLTEPAARTVILPSGSGHSHALLESFGVIVRTGLRAHVGPGERIHLAGTLATEWPDPAGTPTRLADLAALSGDTDPAAWAETWWRRYVGLLVPPVLRLWADHGVVLEPHLQNVLVVVGSDGMPVKVLLRDLEGTKLIKDRHANTLSMMSGDVAEEVGFEAERGWNRVAYCLFVNHLTEIAGALTDLTPDSPGFEDRLWAVLRAVVMDVAARSGRPPRLLALSAGIPLPAKANLLVRWERGADRQAGYVSVPSPFRPQPAELAEEIR